MVKIELMPDLEHCIETVARRRYTELIQRLLGSKTGVRETEEQLEILRLFLETADFGKLRSKSEEQLIQGKKVQFIVYLEDTLPKCEMRVS